MAIAVRDTTYLLDFMEKEFTPEESQTRSQAATNFIIAELIAYSENHLEKFMGLAIPEHVAEHCPDLCSRLWAELDVVPLVLSGTTMMDRFPSRATSETQTWVERTTDEQAESMARKCVRLFGPDNIPLLQVGLMGHVEVDTDFHVRLTNIEDFEKTVSAETWAAVKHYAADLKNRDIKVAMFSATPQGGGVALMRHSLVRFSHCLGTNIKWYVSLSLTQGLTD